MNNHVLNLLKCYKRLFMSDPKIGWQKYEDFLDKQINSPAIDNIMQSISSKVQDIETEEYQDDSAYKDSSEYTEDESDSQSMMFPMSAQFFQDLSMLSTYDCWLGHTNFDITPIIKNKLDNIDGVEVLKICSRYRFFIGLGRMFKFADVRKNVEDFIIPKEEKE